MSVPNHATINYCAYAKIGFPIAGAKAIGNLMFHQQNNRQVSTSFTVETLPPADNEYEFSCSSTPNYIFPFNLAPKKKSNNHYHHLFACTHEPPTLDEENMDTMKAVKVALEMLNKNDSYNNNVVAASPLLPGFGQTPLARQLRITDSPFPLRDSDEDNGHIDKAAEDFINRFYKDLKQQNKRMSEL